MKKILIGALLASVAASAFAADLPTRKGPPVVYTPPPIFTWTGFYVGVNGSYDFASVQDGAGIFSNPSGGMGGGTVGYNYQFGQFVAGLEGDFAFGDVSNKQTIDPAGSFTKLNLEDFATARARLGFAMDRALIYVTGGYAGGEVHGAIFDANTGFYASNNTWQNGYAVGGGLEYAFTNNISAKAEYLFSQLNGTSIATPTYAAKPGLDVSLIRAGLNYRF
ncbi:MAG TPA: outer membrane protein [Roseiarcus sp.]|jgi:outer membrane immunogenic protein|nr:outer membrane protein [Roseiarcus sp.]